MDSLHVTLYDKLKFTRIHLDSCKFVEENLYKNGLLDSSRISDPDLFEQADNQKKKLKKKNLSFEDKRCKEAVQDTDDDIYNSILTLSLK